MLAALLKEQGKVVVEEVPEEPPGAGQVRLRVEAAGICGSDLHNYAGRWGAPEKALGHEFCGVVESVGSGVERWKPGDRVTAECFGHCTECPACLAGDHNHCREIDFFVGRLHGGFAELATCPASALYAIGDLTPEQGALVEPLAVGIRTVTRLGDVAGKEVLVIGAGTIGLTSVAAAKALGASRVSIIARYEHQAKVAGLLGADAILGEEEDISGASAPLVVDSIAHRETLEWAMALVAPYGRVVMVGIMTAPAELRLNPLMGKEATLTGAKCYGTHEDLADFDRAVAWIAAGKVDPTVLVTHRFPLSQAPEAFAAAADKSSGAVKVLFEYGHR